MAHNKHVQAHNRAGGAGPTSPTLVGPKIFIFMVKALYFQSSGRTNNCQIEVLFKWSGQSCTPSAAPAQGTRITVESVFISRFTMNNMAAKLQKFWTHKIAFKNT